MLSAMFIWLASAMTASAGEPTLTLDVWPDEAPGETGSIGPEKVIDQKPGDKPVKLLTNVTQPTLSVFRPACDKDTGVAVVICPGGGYNILAFDLEGEEVAAWLNSIGVTGIVLKYRVPRREGTPRDRPPVQALLDAQRALSLVRSKAGEWRIDPKRIGILGFSAGGHLSAWAATHFDERAYSPIDDADRLSCRPDFAVLVYPGGMDRKGDTSSPIAHVSSTTPPMFLAQAGDDPVDCRNSVEMFLALKNAKVPAELHIYSSGGHGFGLRPSAHPCCTWTHRCEVLELRFLTPPDQIAARYSLGCDCRSCLASTFRPAGVSIFSASSFSSRCSAS